MKLFVRIPERFDAGSNGPLHPPTAGQDATEAFFGLHRYEVLERPQYQRLQVGVVEGEEPQLYGMVKGKISEVPYAEPSWLVKGYHSPYFTDVSGPILLYLSAYSYSTQIEP